MSAHVTTGDALEQLALLPAGSVDCIVTSPPYYALRDYGVDGQIGLEPSLAEYVDRLVAVFRECRRVLAPHGTCWLNLGDSYAAGGSGWRESDPSASTLEGGKLTHSAQNRNGSPAVVGTKAKDMLMVPARVALALQADGWWLRSDIIWSKPNPMPESVRDRPSSSYEHVFLLSKQARYWFDMEAVREPLAEGTLNDSRFGKPTDRDMDAAADRFGEGTSASRRTAGSFFSPTPYAAASGKAAGLGNGPRGSHGGRNCRDVWTIATEPYPGAHFATYPTELARRCVVAGCPREVCETCGVPRERIVNVEYGKSPAHGTGSVTGRREDTGSNGYDGAEMPRLAKHVETVGWSDCGHGTYRPGIVLDPFTGSGTTGVAALREHRHFTGIELNPEYAQMARARLRDWHKRPARPRPAPDAQGSLL